MKVLEMMFHLNWKQMVIYDSFYCKLYDELTYNKNESIMKLKI